MSKLRMALAVILTLSIAGNGITPAHAHTVSSVPPVQSLSQLDTLTDPSRYDLPKTVVGYNVLAVLTADTSACMVLGKKRLILQASQGSLDEYLKASDQAALETAVRESGLRVGDVEVQIVGPTVTLDGILSEIQKWNQLLITRECQKTPPLASGSDWTEIKSSNPSAGWALFEDLDAGSYTNDNAQSVNMTAPASIGNPPLAVVIENNVKTDNPAFYFLQNGLQFYLGVGSVIWTDTTQGYVDQTYAITYVAGHNYFFSITYTNSRWWMCAQDNAIPSSYTCVQETHGTGTTLAADRNTNVWVENHNTISNWYTGFSSPFKAWGAKIYRNGVGQNWASNHRHTWDFCSTSWPPTSALSGSLTGSGTGNFILSGVPRSC